MASGFKPHTWGARPTASANLCCVAGQTEVARSRTPDRERRVPHRAPCRLQWWDSDSKRTASCVGETTNLSERGLAVRVRHFLLTGTRVEILLANLAGDPRRISGVVVRCQRILADTFELGIRFVD